MPIIPAGGWLNLKEWEFQTNMDSQCLKTRRTTKHEVTKKETAMTHFQAATTTTKSCSKRTQVVYARMGSCKHGDVVIISFTLVTAAKKAITMVIVFLLLNKSVLAPICIVNLYKMCVLMNNQHNYNFPETFHLPAKPSELEDEYFL